MMQNTPLWKVEAGPSSLAATLRATRDLENPRSMKPSTLESSSRNPGQGHEPRSGASTWGVWPSMGSPQLLRSLPTSCKLTRPAFSITNTGQRHGGGACRRCVSRVPAEVLTDRVRIADPDRTTVYQAEHWFACCTYSKWLPTLPCGAHVCRCLPRAAYSGDGRSGLVATSPMWQADYWLDRHLCAHLAPADRCFALTNGT